jgi:hypothetical protein
VLSPENIPMQSHYQKVFYEITKIVAERVKLTDKNKSNKKPSDEEGFFI